MSILRLFGGSGSVQTPSRVVDVFEQLTKCRLLYTTRNCEGYETEEKASGKKVILWRLCFPLQSVSPEAVAFVERVSSIARSGIRTPRILSFGVDLGGTAFVITEHVLFRPISSVPRHPNEMGPILLKMLSLVSTLHNNNIVLGDISEHSFFIDNRGKIYLGCFLGSFDLGELSGRGNTALEITSFTSPEQRTGGYPQPASDIYSLGVYIYKLLTGRYFTKSNDEESHSEHVKTFVPNMLKACHEAPAWSQEFLQTSLQWNPQNRYTGSEEIIKLIKRSRHATKKIEKRENTGLRFFLSEEFFNSAVEFGTTPSAIMAVAIVGVLLFIANQKNFWGTYKGEANVTVAQVIQGNDSGILPQQSTGGNSKNLLEMLAEEPDMDEGEEEDDDWSEYFHFGKGSYDEKEQSSQVEKSGLQSDNKGNSTKKPTRNPSKRGSGKEKNRLNEKPLTNRPKNTQLAMLRKSVIRKSYRARSWESVQKEKNKQTSNYSTTSTNEREPTSPHRDSKPKYRIYSRQDASRVLKNAYRYDENILILAADRAIQFRMYSELHSVFLHLLLNEKPSPQSIVHRQAMARAAAGHIGWKELRVLGNWYSPLAELGLLAACASAEDPEMAVVALTYLASRPLFSEPANSLIVTLKTHYWNKRRKLAKHIGIMGLTEELLKTKEYSAAFAEMLPYAPEIILRLAMQINIPANPDDSLWCPYQQ